MAAPRFTTEQAYREAFLHDDYILMCRPLLPFSFRMWLILDELKSPLIHGGPIGIGDLQDAVIVCSTPTTGQFWRGARREGFYWRIWRWATRRLSVSRNLAIFNRYVEDFMPEYPFWKSAEGGEEKVPGEFLVLARLLGSVSPSSLIDLPIGEAVGWGLAKRTVDNLLNDRLMSDLDVQALREIDAATKGKP